MRAALPLLILLLVACGSGEPEHLGRSVAEWSKTFEPPWSADKREAEDVFVAGGEEALAVANALLDRLSVPGRARLVGALNEIEAPPERSAPLYTRALSDRSPVVRLWTAWHLRSFDAPSEVLLPLLRIVLADEEAAVRYAGARGLGGEAVALVPDLLAAAAREKGYLRGGILLALARLAPKDEEVVILLHEALTEAAAFASLEEQRPPRQEEVMGFHESFGFMMLFLLDTIHGPGGVEYSNPDDALENLREWFEDEGDILGDTVDAILVAGAPLVPGLITRLTSRNPSQRLIAALVLGKIEDDSGAPGQALLGVLDDESAEVRVAASSALLHRGAAGPEVVAALREVLAAAAAPDAAAAAAVSVLGGFDPLSAEARAALLAAGADPRWLVREAGFYALAAAGVDGPEAAGVLGPALREDEATRVRYAAAMALLSLPEAAAECLYPLLTASRLPEWEIREVAVLALGRVATRSEEARRAVLLAREDDAEEVRTVAGKLLAGGDTDLAIEQSARKEIAARQSVE